ncbi:SGNH/GDSL hydrolase family protein [Pseudonocardia eucalypti]|uniref:SGNH/GDSL hydrolase family protein n=1 Tax=Pseudonocardia eucalypti TaxID=648755 RepID=A0ABP9R9Y1_9PSEU|nr:lysophospholipase L1-like esterase [Pseudonocardia eucalypti]
MGQRLLTVCLTVVALAVSPSSVSQAADGVGEYVALGDSYTSGSFIPVQLDRPLGCERSDRNYPSLVVAALRPAVFRDVSCGGATTGNLTQPQRVRGDGVNPPQLEALTARTDLITLGIGANDIGFADIVGSCTTRSVTRPLGAACRDYYHRGGGDELGARVDSAAPRVAAALRAVRDRAPKAKVLVIGYPAIVSDAGLGCLPLSPGDAGYLSRTFGRLNAMLAEQAREAGVGFVDTASGSAGHDACQPPGVRWVEGAVATTPAAPWHPNAAGMRHVAERVLSALRAG